MDPITPVRTLPNPSTPPDTQKINASFATVNQNMAVLAACLQSSERAATGSNPKKLRELFDINFGAAASPAMIGHCDPNQPNDPVWEEINDDLQKSNGSKGCKDILFKHINGLSREADRFLDTIAFDFRRLHSQLLRYQKLPVKTIAAIWETTFTQKELQEQKIGLEPLPQNSFMTSVALMRYFISADIPNMMASRMFHLIRSIAEVLGFFKIASNQQFADKEPQLSAVMHPWVNRKIEKLKVGETLALPGGWAALDKMGIAGHFMILLVKRVSATVFSLTRINSHKVMESSCPCQEKTLKKAEVKQLVSHAIKCYFPKTLQIKLQNNPSKDHIQYLYNEPIMEGARNYQGIQFEMQTETINCIFMSYYLLFQHQYLEMQREPNPTNIPLDVLEKANAFKDDFQKTLYQESFKSHIKKL